jgi:hypothetical protein
LILLLNNSTVVNRSLPCSSSFSVVCEPEFLKKYSF